MNWRANREIALEGPPITFDGFSAAVHAAPHGLLNVVGAIHLLLAEFEKAGRYDALIQRDAFVRAVCRTVWGVGGEVRQPSTAMFALDDVFSLFAELSGGNRDGDRVMGDALVVGVSSLMEPQDGDTLCGMLFDIFDVDGRGVLRVPELEQLFEWRATFRSAFEVAVATRDSIKAAATRAAARMVADVGGHDGTVRAAEFAEWLTTAQSAEQPAGEEWEAAPPVPPALEAGTISQRVADAVGSLPGGALALTGGIYQLVVESAARGSADGRIARAAFVRKMVSTVMLGALRGDGGVAALDDVTVAAAFERVFALFSARSGVRPLVERVHADALLAGATALGGARDAALLCDMLFDLYDPRDEGALDATTLVAIFASRVAFRSALDGDARDAQEIEAAAQSAVQALLRDVDGVGAQRASRGAFASWLRSKAGADVGVDARSAATCRETATGAASAPPATVGAVEANAMVKSAAAVGTVGARMQRMVIPRGASAGRAREPWRVVNISGRALPILVGDPPGVAVGRDIADGAVLLVRSKECFHAADGTRFVLLYLATGSDDLRLWTIAEVKTREGAETQLIERWSPWSAHADLEQGRWCVALARRARAARSCGALVRAPAHD